jgi:hypothetical protein
LELPFPVADERDVHGAADGRGEEVGADDDGQHDNQLIARKRQDCYLRPAWERCCDFFLNISAEKFSENLGVFLLKLLLVFEIKGL